MSIKKRFLCVVLLLATVALCMPGMSVTVSADGITEPGDLMNAIQSGISFTLGADIDMRGVSVTPASANGITVNGNGHVIKNLTMTGGMYTSAANCTFQDLALYHCFIVDMSAGSDYGFLADRMSGCFVNGCAVDGEIAVYGSGASNVGGLAGQITNTTISNSFAMCDIYTDGSYVGGLVGKINRSTLSVNLITSSPVTVSNVYSTGNIDNDGRDHIGGLVGGTSVSISNAYTTTFIKNAYADTVKAIGCLENGALFTNVYYDKTISLQRQDDLDNAYDISSITSSNIGTKLSGFAYSAQLYPELLGLFYFSDLSVISRARVDLDLPRTSGLLTGSTGREYMKPSTASAYSYATLSHGGNLGFDWEISGGADEYFFDPSSAPETAYGGTINGLSGNTYDVNTGKYLFVNTGDIAFTAKKGGYERTIVVHVTDDNPYITGGKGLFEDTDADPSVQADPFLISNPTELNNVRLYCLDGGYNYKCDADISLSGDFTPILGFKGSFDGNGKTISGLTVSAPNGTDAGLLATISGNNSSVSSLHIAGASVAPTSGSPAAFSAANAGILCGSVSASGVTISDVFVSGEAGGSAYSGLLVGNAGSASIARCASMGNSGVSDTAVSAVSGGIAGTRSGSMTDCYSTAVVQGTAAGGLAAAGSGSYTRCLFTGMFKNSVTRYPLANDGTNVNSFFDVQSTAIPNSDDVTCGRTVSELKAAAFSSLGANWTSTDPALYPYINTFPAGWSSAVQAASCPLEYSLGGLSWVSGLASSSHAFNTAVIGNAGTVSGTAAGYSFDSNTNTFTKTTGGAALYTLTYGGDRRTVYFNVNSVNVYVKYNFNSTQYSLDGFGMDGVGLISITADWGDEYHVAKEFTNNTEQLAFSLPAVPGSIKTAVVLPPNYSASVTCASAYQNGTPNTAVDDRFLIGDTQTDICLTVTVSQDTSKWGVFRSFCRKLVLPSNG